MTLRAITGHGEPEAYVSRREMARQLGVSVSTLDDMVRRREVPSETWGRRTRRFLPSAVRLAVGSRPSVVIARDGAGPTEEAA